MKRMSLRCFAFASVSALVIANLTAVTSAQTVYTEPVGVVTLEIDGPTGGAGSQLSFKGLGLTRPVEYQGAAESVTATTLVDNDATWTDNQFNPPGATVATATHYVEIISGAAAGAMLDIVGTNAATKTLTLGQELPAGVANGDQFKIRRHWTIGTVFGNPPPAGGLAKGDATTADQVLIYNGSGYDIYYYLESVFGSGWVNAANPGASAADTKILPEDGVIVKRQSSGSVSVVLTGAVKTGQTSVPVFTGTNIIGNVYATDMTLGSSGLFSDAAGNNGVLPGDPGVADQVLLYNGTGYDTYYYSNGGANGTGWRQEGQGATDKAATAIPFGSSVIVKRRGANGFNWVIPQHPASFN